MKKIFLAFLFVIAGLSASAQTYQELFDRSVALVEADSLLQAEVIIKQALKLEPANAKNALLFSNLGLVMRRQGKYEAAIEAYSYALNALPRAVPILLERAALYLQQGERDRALVDYSMILDLKPDLPEALLMRAYIYMQKRDFPSARADYEHLLRLDPQNYSGRLGLATLAMKEGRHRESLDMLNKMLAEYPDDETLYTARAGVEIEMEHTELALIDLEKAIGLNDSVAEAYLMRGDIYLGNKKKALAKQDFEKARSLGIPQEELHVRMQQCK